MSCDVFLGIPFNIASYGLLLELIAAECGMVPGKLIGFLGDVHIYVNHFEQIKLQMSRKPFPAPELELDDNFTSIFDWEWQNATLNNYVYHPSIKAEVAV